MTDPFVRPDVRAFLSMLEAMPGPRLHEQTPAQARAQYGAMRSLADLPVGDLATVRDLSIPSENGTIPARLFDAREARQPGPIVVFYHGGGFVIGDLDSHAGFCAELARGLDLPVVAVDYRLSPEAPWPAAPDDAEAAARWVATAPEALGRTVTGLVLVGDSAGGNLAIVTAAALRDDPAAVPVIAQAPIYPATDTSRVYPSHDLFRTGYLLTDDSLSWFDRAYAADRAHVRASPLLGRVDGLPPALVLTASLDPIRDQGRAYAAALVDAGVHTVFREAVGNIHGFFTLRKAIPSSAGDVAGFVVALRALITEAEAQRVMDQAAGVAA